MGNIPKTYQNIQKHTISDKSKKGFDVYQNVSIEPKHYLVMIRLLIFMYNFTFGDFAMFVNLCRLAFMSKTTFLQHVADKMLRAK